MVSLTTSVWRQTMGFVLCRIVWWLRMRRVFNASFLYFHQRIACGGVFDVVTVIGDSFDALKAFASLPFCECLETDLEAAFKHINKCLYQAKLLLSPILRRAQLLAPKCFIVVNWAFTTKSSRITMFSLLRVCCWRQIFMLSKIHNKKCMLFLKESWLVFLSEYVVNMNFMISSNWN